MSRKPKYYRVYNHSSQPLIVSTRGRTKADPPEHFRLLPGCASPDAARPIRLQAETQVPIGDAEVWDIKPPFDVHVTERDQDVAPRLSISGFGITKSRQDWSRIETDKVWASRKDDTWVTVLGAGITGLTAAHELVTRGFRVQVIEKAHGSPVDETEPHDRRAPTSVRFHRGLERPDVGGIARTQWSTQPLSRGDNLLMTQAQPAKRKPTGRIAAMRSVHGDCHWFGSEATGGQHHDGYWAFGVPWLDGALGPNVANELYRWLRRLSMEHGRSIAAVQLVVVVYRDPDDSSTPLVEAAYRRLADFQRYLGTPEAARLREHLENVEVFPTARVDVDDRAIPGKSVGLLVRVHEDLGLVAGEHGFRFFPGFYRHLRDTMRRTPIYDPQTRTFTTRTALDNLTEVQWQIFADPKRKYPASLLRRPFTSIGGLTEQYRTMRRDLGYRPVDLLRFLLRLLRYMTSSMLRRDRYYEKISWWDFLSIRRFDIPTSDTDRFQFGQRFEEALRHAPKALVAMVSDYADARTQGNIAVQLFMDQFDLHDQSDSTLSGPTSAAWLSHWRTYLEHQGVRFFLGEVTKIHRPDASDARADEPAEPAFEPYDDDEDIDDDDDDGGHDDDAPDPTEWRIDEARHESSAGPRAIVDIAFPGGPPRNYVDAEALFRDKKIHAHYYLSAMDIVGLVRTTRSFRPYPVIANPSGKEARRFGVLSELARLIVHGGRERDLEDIAEVGRIGDHHGLDDRFQTLTGIQFYYRSHISFENGHIYFASSPWGLSAVSQIQYWGPFGGGRRSRLAGNLSVDIGAWRPIPPMTPDPNELARDDIASRIQDQILRALGESQRGREAVAAYYHLDDYIEFVRRAHQLLPARNRAPFLINRVRDWHNRPSGDPWDPDDLQMRERMPGIGKTSPDGIWCHQHGGYPVHFGNLVIAGPHLRTFTRMTTMEAANESARHAVNAILDHLSFARRDAPPTEGPLLTYETSVQAASAMPSLLGKTDPAPNKAVPRGMNPPRLGEADKKTTPYGDYCEIWNPETHEFPDLDFLRLVDEHLMKATIESKDDRPEGPEPIAPHLFDILRIDELPDSIESDREAFGAFELIGSVLGAFQESSFDALPGLFAVIETARKKLTALLEKKR